MKKRLAAIVSLIVIVCGCGACRGGVAPTQGQIAVVAVSQQTYADAEQAVKAYVTHELRCTETVRVQTVWGDIIEQQRESIGASYIGHTRLAAVAVDELALDAPQKRAIRSVERVAVRARIRLLDRPESAATEIRQTAYILNYTDLRYAYLVSDPVPGERWTNSDVKRLTDCGAFARVAYSVFCETTDAQGNMSFAEAYQTALTPTAVYRATYTSRENFDDLRPDSERYVLPTADGTLAIEKQGGMWTQAASGQETFAECVRETLRAIAQTVAGAVAFVATETGAQREHVTVTTADGKLRTVTETAIDRSTRTEYTFSDWGTATLKIPDFSGAN